MKQRMIIGAIITLMLASMSATEELDRAITQVGNNLNERIPKGDKIAFVGAGQEFPNLMGYIIDGLVEKAVNDRLFSVVDRTQLDAIRAEQQFQASGDVDDATMQSMGRILGVKTIITVKVTQIGDMFQFSVRALGVESAEILAAPRSPMIPSSPMVLALVETRRAAPAPVSGPATPQSAATSSTAHTSEPARKKRNSATTSGKSKTAQANRPSGPDLDMIISRYENLLRQCETRRTDRCADVMYTLGSLYYDRESYAESSTIYSRLLSEYPRYPKNPSAQRQLAELKEMGY